MVAWLLLLPGCVVKIDRQSGDSRTLYVGIVTVEVRTQNPQSGTLAVGETTLGMRIRNGLSAGILRDHMLYMPEDCRIVFLVKTKDQLESALGRLKLLPDNLCAAQDRSLQ